MSAPTSPASPATGSTALWRLPLTVLSSLRLTVVLLALSIAVVFFGTLAQTEDGLYLAQAKYFRSYWSVWSPHSADWRWLKVPLPGGYLLGFLLLANLLAAHLTRFHFTWKKSGIFLTHIGIILLLVGQLTTDMFARESRMRFAEGEYRNYTEGFQESEIAVLTDAPDASMDQVVAFPQPELRAGAELQNTTLPFKIRIVEYYPNSDPDLRNDADSGKAFSGIGREFDFKGIPETFQMDSKNVPSAVVEVVGADGKDLGRWALSGWAGDADMANVLFVGWMRSFQKRGDGSPFVRARKLVDQITEPQTVEVAGKRYTLVLRPERYYEPFSLILQRVTHEVYPGTDVPKNFQSRVRIDNPATGENREVDIYMNNPLRYGGLTFFQHQMDASSMNLDNKPVTVFQVVKNPTWLTPYIGTIVVGLGLLVQFSIHLVGFLRKRPAR